MAIRSGEWTAWCGKEKPAWQREGRMNWSLAKISAYGIIHLNRARASSRFDELRPDIRIYHWPDSISSVVTLLS